MDTEDRSEKDGRFVKRTSDDEVEGHGRVGHGAPSSPERGARIPAPEAPERSDDEVEGHGRAFHGPSSSPERGHKLPAPEAPGRSDDEDVEGHGKRIAP